MEGEHVSICLADLIRLKIIPMDVSLLPQIEKAVSMSFIGSMAIAGDEMFELLVKRWAIAQKSQVLLRYVHASSTTDQHLAKETQLRLALRPYVTAGVAIVGASVIAITPITPTPTPAQAQTHSVQLSAAVQNLQKSDAPTPFNTLAIPSALPDIGHYGPLFAKALQNYVEALGTYFTTNMPAGLREAFGQLVSGDITGAAYTFLVTVNGAIMTPGASMFPVLPIPGDILDDLGMHNLAKAVDSLIGAATLWPLLGAVTGPVYGAIWASAHSAQAAWDAIGVGNPIGAITELLKLPAAAVGAFINGYDYYRGLLTDNQYGLGLIPTLVKIVPRAIALALGMAPTSAALAVAAQSTTAASTALVSADAALPSADAQAISLDAGSAAQEDAAGGAQAEETSGETPEPAAEGEAGTVTEEAAPENEMPATDAVDGFEETDSTDGTTGTEGSEEPKDTEGSEESDGSESPNGSTDLSDGNKAEPGQPGSDTGAGAGSGSESESDTPATETGTDDTGNKAGADTGSNDSGSDAGGSNDGSDGGSDS